MSLTYQNIFDYEAEQFVDHYDEVFGTLNPFSIASAGTADGGKTGWNGFNVPGPFSSGGYSVLVTPASLVEGDRFDILFQGPANLPVADRTLEVEIKGNGITSSDFDGLFTGVAPHPLTGQATLDVYGFTDAKGNGIAIDTSITPAEGLEVMTIEVYNPAKTALLASVSVPIVDRNSPVSPHPAAKTSTIGAGAYSSGWRYEGPPQLTQVRPGISTVTVNLVAVL